MIYEYAGGTLDDRPIKTIIPGGLSMPHLGVDKLDTPIDFESIVAAGSMLGSGGIIVICEGDNIVAVARRTAASIARKACGKCTPCREGTGWMEKTLERIEHGEGQLSDLDTMVRLTKYIERQTFCPFGPAAVWGLRSLLKLFRADFEAFIQRPTPTAKRRICPCGPSTGRIRVKRRRRSGYEGRVDRLHAVQGEVERI